VEGPGVAAAAQLRAEVRLVVQADLLQAEDVPAQLLQLREDGGVPLQRRAGRVRGVLVPEKA